MVPGVTEVVKLNLIYVFHYPDVFHANIAMHDVVFVAVLNSCNQLSENLTDLTFTKPSVVVSDYVVIKIATLGVI